MLVRLILWLILGFLVYTVYQAVRQALKRPPSPPPEKSAGGEEMVHDPVCGTYVPRGDAVLLRHGGRNLHFCSADCRDRFLADKG